MSRLLRAYKTLGVLFLVLLVGAVYLTYAIFDKKFTSYEEVTLKTTTVGLQLPERADVKIRGVIVGEVLDQQPNDNGGADVTLGIYSDMASTVPADVTGAILPKTLFGEKFVSLIVPSGPLDKETIQAGAVLDKTEIPTEVEAVLNDLYPLLRTVEPAQLNMTLNAIATALEGRGNALGENLVTLDNYLRRLNPQIPLLISDLRKAGQVGDIYSDILPQVGQILDDTVKTTGTLETKEQKLKALLDDTGSLSDSLRTFLADNEQNLVQFGRISTAQLRVFSRYAPEFPCLLGGVNNAGKINAEAFRGFELHIVLETLPNQPRSYTPADKPVIGEDRGPNCLHLPNPPWSQSNPVRRVPNFNDGVDSPTGKGTDRVAPGYAIRDGSGFAGSAAESDLYRQLMAPGLGEQPADVDDLGPMLMAPMARGAAVSMR